ncbi:MAG: hypothetical protein WA441_03135 [Methyloceanibacter sp.]
MTMMEAVKVVPALREAAVLEPLAAIMTLYESATIAARETVTSWSRAIKVAACIRSGTAIGAAGEVAATARHCAGMATTTATTIAATMRSKLACHELLHEQELEAKHGCKIDEIRHIALGVDLADVNAIIDVALVHDAIEET